MFDDDPEKLPDMVGERFPNAEISEDSVPDSRVLQEAVASVETPGSLPRLPLDISGTAFQKLVWKALMEIPPGITATYGEVAAKIGRVEASRAVAGACAANKIALFIPCHRVVRHNGDLGGYRWGRES